jgi:hypothetical protein
MFLSKFKKKSKIGRKEKWNTISRINNVNFLQMISKYIRNVLSDDEYHSIPVYHF